MQFCRKESGVFVSGLAVLRPSDSVHKNTQEDEGNRNPKHHKASLLASWL